MSFVTPFVADACGFPTKSSMVKYLSDAENEISEDIYNLKADIEKQTRILWKKGFKEIVKKHKLQMDEIIRETSNKITIANKLKKADKEASERAATEILGSTRSESIVSWNNNVKRGRTISVESSALTEFTPNLSLSPEQTITPVLDLPVYSSSDGTVSEPNQTLPLSVSKKAKQSPPKENVQCQNCKTNACEILKLKLQLRAAEFECEKAKNDCKKMFDEKSAAMNLYSSALKRINELNAKLGTVKNFLQ